MELNFIRSNIKSKRRAAGITQREMSTRLFMDERTYSKIERGEKKSVDVSLLSSIADILNTDVATLMLDPAKAKNMEHINTLEKAQAQQIQFFEEYKEMMAEIKVLQDEVRHLIVCHKAALGLLATPK